MIKEVAFINYPVTDMPRARAFYEGTLGLKPTMTHEQFMEYDLGAATFAISIYGKPSADGPCVAFEVDDYDAEVSRLRAAGVEFIGDTHVSPVCRMIMAKDVDGNQFLIHQRNAGHA